MKRLIAFILCMILLCGFSFVTFAAESPTATEKVTVTIRKAESVSPTEKPDVVYTLSKGQIVTVKSHKSYGTFNDWSVYKVVSASQGTVVEAVEGVDYIILSGDLESNQMKIKVLANLIVCGNYNGVKTDPLVTGDGTDTSPQTSDSIVPTFFALIMSAALLFGVKKQLSK